MARLTLHLWSAAVALRTAMRTVRLGSQMRRGAWRSHADRSDRRRSPHETKYNA
jgi:hypothetical protein